MSDAELQQHRAKRITVAKIPGTPCRVSLQDAEVGEEVILVHYEHQSADSPFRSSDAVYVRNNVEQGQFEMNEIPELFRHRLMSVRGFSEGHYLVDADAVEGTELETILDQILGNPNVDYIHLRYAKSGCFAARVERRQQ